MGHDGSRKKQPTFGTNHSNTRAPSGRVLQFSKGSSITWADIPNQLIRDALVSVCDNGASIMFSRTSDGGALGVRVFDGDQILKEYPHTVEEAAQVLGYLVDVYGVADDL